MKCILFIDDFPFECLVIDVQLPCLIGGFNISDASHSLECMSQKGGLQPTEYPYIASYIDCIYIYTYISYR